MTKRKPKVAKTLRPIPRTFDGLARRLAKASPSGAKKIVARINARYFEHAPKKRRSK